VVSNPHARFGLSRRRETVVDVPTDAQVEEPVASLDLIFDVHGKLFYIGVTEIAIRGSAPRKVVRSENGEVIGVL
jgi:hypothetical protein